MASLSGLILSGVLVYGVLAFASLPASAQDASGTSPQGRNCQTVLTCNFRRGASVRGCLSSYSCRACRLVAARCTVGPNLGKRLCQEMRCGWGATGEERDS